MRYSALMLFILFWNLTWAQVFYGSTSVGYQQIIQTTQPPSHIVNTYHQITHPWFWRAEDVAFKNAMNANLSLGHLPGKNWGYELSASYTRPFDQTMVDELVTRTLSGKFLTVGANLILTIPKEKVDFYTKLGVNYILGNIRYHQSFKNNEVIPYSFESSELTYEYTNGSSFGYNMTLGGNFKIGQKLSIFAELNGSFLPFSPEKGRRIHETIDGQDQLQYANDPYFSEIEFGNETEHYAYNSDDKQSPQKLYRRNYSLGGIGLNVGVRFIIWEKRKPVDVNQIPEEK